jgi:PTH2 family peptidyl-tRNA hydrolase
VPHEDVCVGCKVKNVVRFIHFDEEVTEPFPRCAKCERPFCTKCMPTHECLLLKYKAVIAIRKDLNMSPGKIAAQAAHAAVELTLLSLDENGPGCRIPSETFVKWQGEGARVVVVGVENFEQLKKLHKSAIDTNSLNTVAYADGGITEVDPGTVTVLGIGPARNEEIDKITKELEAL